MNTVLSSHPELPLTLPAANPNLRVRAGLMLEDAALLQFNYHLHDVRRDAPSVDAGQFAQLARWLETLPAETAQATIALRLARAESLRRMLDDPYWILEEDIRERGVHLLDYLYRFDDLIPDDLPVIGHLDDALLIELSWSEFEGEVRDHEDFARFCEDSGVRGTAAERRDAWEAHCLAQASTLLHRQSVRERGYARPEPLSRPFRVC